MTLAQGAVGAALGIALLAVLIAIAISSSREVAKERLEKPKQPYENLGYLAQNGNFLGDTDTVENAYLESRLGGYTPSGRASDPEALRKLSCEEE